MANGRDLAGMDGTHVAEQETVLALPEPPQLPPALARFVVRQDHARYDAADHATWRFALLHLMQHLGPRAHPLYLDGLRRSGLVPAQIPKISEVDARLSAWGWRAVPVSGFLPPRAFQQLQALGILPIAADIRTPDHIAYTPSPDIVHEAIGHAPLLSDPLYAAYLRRVGSLGSVAFSSPEDHALHTAIARLSAVKEQTSAGDPLVQHAEQQLSRAMQAQHTVSEANRMSRLYWWTAEYGLIGSLDNFKLYGAGLLSSLAESLHCFGPRVEKRPLDSECLDTPYDITRQQPQLFVVPSFERLFDVVSSAERTLAANQSPLASLNAAWESRLPARLELSTGHELHGTVRRFGIWQGTAAWIELGERARLVTPAVRPEAIEDATSPSKGPIVFPLGLPEALPRRDELLRLASTRSKLRLRYPCGVTLQGTLLAVGGHEYEPVLHWEEVCLQRAGSTTLARNWQQPLFAQLRRALPLDGVGATEQTVDTAPVARRFTANDQLLRKLYEQAQGAWLTRASNDAVPILRAVHGHLVTAHPEEWLLRWNLLESLLHLGETEHSTQLERELEILEDRFSTIYPIATGLRSLERLRAGNDNLQEAS